jgi:DNA-binding winged helix-turn-helix (wHTH) protein/tetratricopeptide (TPR) repeat protein
MVFSDMASWSSSQVPDNPLPPEPENSRRTGVSYEFDGFRLDPANRRFTRAGQRIPLSGRAFDLLLMLVQRPGKLIKKEELLFSVWGESFVEEANLTVAISTLRRALNEDRRERKYIETVARRGYCFVAEVREVQETASVGKLEREAITPPIAAEPTSDATAQPLSEASIDLLPISAESKPEPAVVPAPIRMPRWPVLVFAAVLIGILGVGLWLLLRPSQPIRTLAVLPFTQGTSSADSRDAISKEVILLGITDRLISRLGEQVIVRPTSSVLRYSETSEGLENPVNPIVAGREQDVDAVITGAMDQEKGGTVLHLRLIRTRDGVTLWQDSFTTQLNELSALEQTAGDAAAAELHHLGAVNAKKNEPLAPSNHANDVAYQLYLRGRYFWNRRTVDGLNKSVDYFRQAIAADPNYALAYAGLADSYALLASFSIEPVRSANADERSAALSAIQLDPTLAEPHASLGMIYFYTDWDFSAAEREFERSIELNPNYATAHHWYALNLASMGRFPQALYEIHLAQKLDPLSLIIGTNLGWVEYLSRDYVGAARDLHWVLELDPNFVRARARLGIVEMATGDHDAAIRDLSQALALSGDEDPWVEGLLGDAEASDGNRAAALKALDDLNRRATSHYVPPISRALVLIGLGQKSEAIAALGQAVDDHSVPMVYGRVDPALDPLRGEPAFQALIHRMQ